MELIISTLVHGRHGTAIMCNQKNREAGIEHFTCAYTRPQDRELAEAISDYQDCVPNNISRKAQASLLLTKKLRHQAVMLMGCDDYIDRDAYELIEELLKDHDYIGFKDMYFRSGEDLYLWPGYPHGKRFGEPAGAGKVLRADLLDKLDYYVFTTRNEKTTDLDAHKRIMEFAENPIFISCVEEGVKLVDVKDLDSKTPLSRFDYLIPVVPNHNNGFPGSEWFDQQQMVP